MVWHGMNLMGVLVAAILGFAAGAVWYGLLGKQWLAALGKSADEMKPHPTPFIVAIIANVVMAIVLAGLLGHVGELTLGLGLVVAGLMWLGFVVTTMAVNHSFQGAKPMLTLIDSGHWLLVLLVQGATIGSFGLGM